MSWGQEQTQKVNLRPTWRHARLFITLVTYGSLHILKTGSVYFSDLFGSFDFRLNLKNSFGIFFQFLGPDLSDSHWPYWDREGAECAQGSILIGGSILEPIECQTCPRGTVYVRFVCTAIKK